MKNGEVEEDDAEQEKEAEEEKIKSKRTKKQKEKTRKRMMMTDEKTSIYNQNNDGIYDRYYANVNEKSAVPCSNVIHCLVSLLDCDTCA